MNLTDTFKAVMPSVVAFATTVVQAEAGSLPLTPTIFATGFIVDPCGIVATNSHVIESFDNAPIDSRTGKPAIGVILFHCGRNDAGKDYIRWVPVRMKYHTALGTFQSDGPWYGQDVPDLGFVQLEIKDVPALPLATADNYLQIGMPVATAGFPMGSDSMTALRKLNQMTPFLRRGIVSSVFPFPIEQPHGFTIDVLQQGGSSGSPIFYEDRPEVVGMMSSSLPDFEYEETEAGVNRYMQNTNISVCVTSASIRHALDTFKAEYPPKLDGVMSLDEHLATVGMRTTMGWKIIRPPS